VGRLEHVHAVPGHLPLQVNELAVLATATLQSCLETVASLFEKARPGVAVKLAFSDEEAPRPRRGTDVLAAYDGPPLAALAKRRLIDKPALFARNAPVIIVPAGNPAGVERLIDLLRVKRLAIVATRAPIAGCTQRLFAIAEHKFGGKFRQKVTAVARREPTAARVLERVAAGEADAGIVFHGDVHGSDKVHVVTLPDELNAPAACAVAVVVGARDAALAGAWVDFLRSPDGQRQVAAAGLIPTL
jgi:molybdate transport system substrate-binding protein